MTQRIALLTICSLLSWGCLEPVNETEWQPWRVPVGEDEEWGPQTRARWEAVLDDEEVLDREYGRGGWTDGDDDQGDTGSEDEGSEDGDETSDDGTSDDGTSDDGTSDDSSSNDPVPDPPAPPNEPEDEPIVIHSWQSGQITRPPEVGSGGGDSNYKCFASMDCEPNPNDRP